jgi:aspartyl-tRNA(Asn)/glutamyl-tRNA(Gln) amidotransferase subunit A
LIDFQAAVAYLKSRPDRDPRGVGLLSWAEDPAHFVTAVRPLFDTYDLLLTPTVSVAAFEVGRLNPAHFPQHAWDWFPWASFSYPFNFTGQPASTVPAGFTPSGMPVGLQIVGRRHADRTVLAASAAFEAAHPWQDRRPSVE